MTKIAPLLGNEPAIHGSRANGAAERIARGLAANVGGVGVTLVIQLVSVPVFLASWGVSAYGEWLVLSAVPIYLAMSDLSFSTVAGNSMVMLVAQGRREDAADLGRHLWSIATVMTGIGVTVAVTIALFFGGAFGTGAAISAPEVRVVLVALFLQVAVGNQYGVLDAWYRAGGRYPTSSALRNLGRLLEFGSLMGAVLLGAGPGMAAVAFLAGSVAGFGVSWTVLRRAVPWSTFRPERPHLQTFRDLFAPGVGFMAFPAGNALSHQGFVIAIGAALGVGSVVVFSTTRTISHIALLTMAQINNSISPELSRSIASGDLAEARGILRRSVQLSVAVSCSLVVGLALFGVAVIRWWTHGLVDPPLPLLFILLLVILANSTWYTMSAVLTATNQHRRMAAVYLLGTTAALSLAALLTSPFGLVGAAAALLTIDLAMVTYVFPAALRVVQDVPGTFLRALLGVRAALRSLISIVTHET